MYSPVAEMPLCIKIWPLWWIVSRKLFVSHCGVSSLIESIRAGVPVIGVPQGRDQFFLARNLQKAKIGIELTSEPDPTDLMQAIGTILSNWLLYHNRMKEVLHQLTYNSQENLERVIDMFAGKGHVVTFAEDGSLFPTWQAFALVGTVFCTALILTIGLVFCLARLFCRRMSGSKEKTNWEKQTLLNSPNESMPILGYVQKSQV